MYDIFVVSIAKPILVGIYHNNKLIQTITKDGQTSDILPQIINDILQEKSISNIYFVNGPGSYMAIKVAYIFLKTISQIKKINFQACSGFEINNYSPIKALGKKYFFIKNDGTIYIDILSDTTILHPFVLPDVLDKNIFTSDTLPQYYLPAVS